MMRECSAVQPGGGARRTSGMGWAQRLINVFRIDIQGVRAPRREVKVIAGIEDLEVVENSLVHLDLSDQVEMNQSGAWLTRRKIRSSPMLPRYVPATAYHEWRLWGGQFNGLQVRIGPI
jgi:hypothetical protein